MKRLPAVESVPIATSLTVRTAGFTTGEIGAISPRNRRDRAEDRRRDRAEDRWVSAAAACHREWRFRVWTRAIQRRANGAPLQNALPFDEYPSRVTEETAHKANIEMSSKRKMICFECVISANKLFWEK